MLCVQEASFYQLPPSYPICESPVAELVRHYPIRSLNAIAHIHKATQGPVGLENTHPFMHELWGCYRIFAHNDNLDGRVALIATLPFTDNETRIPLPVDTVTMFVDGVYRPA